MKGNHKVAKNGWLAIITGIFAAYVMCMLYGKIAASSTFIMDYYSVNSHQVGLLVSVVGLCGVILSLPFGTIVSKYGPHKIGLVTTGCGFIGSAMGLFAPNFEILLLSRVFEGVGFGTIAAIVPTIITNWTDQRNRPIFMCILACAPGFGQLIMLLFSRVIFKSLQAQSFKILWIITTVLAFLAFILWVKFAKNPDGAYLQKTNVPSGKFSLSKGFKNPIVWAIAISMLLIAICNTGLSTYTLNYCVEHGMSAINGITLTTIRTFVIVGVSIACGFVLSPMKLKGRTRFYLVGALISYIGYSVMWWYESFIGGVLIMVFIGIGNALMPAIANSIAPDISYNKRLTGVTNGFFCISQNIGAMFTAFTGTIIDVYSFDALAVITSVLGLIIFLCIIYVNSKVTKSCK